MTDCVLWTGADNGRGYQRAWIDGRLQYVHVWAWECENGPVPAGLEIDHLCGQVACFLTVHLEAVTHEENMRRKHAKITHCVSGHERNSTNSWTDPKTNRKHCRVCARDRKRQQRATRKEANGL